MSMCYSVVQSARMGERKQLTQIPVDGRGKKCSIYSVLRIGMREPNFAIG